MTKCDTQTATKKNHKRYSGKKSNRETAKTVSPRPEIIKERQRGRWGGRRLSKDSVEELVLKGGGWKDFFRIYFTLEVAGKVKGGKGREGKKKRD